MHTQVVHPRPPEGWAAGSPKGTLPHMPRARSRPMSTPTLVTPQPRPKLKKLRLAVVLLGLGTLALVSTVFGMMMAVASDLPALENEAEYKAAKNSVLYGDTPTCRKAADKCPEIARLTGNQNRILLTPDKISPNIKNAVIAVEDRRFYEHGGVDYKGIARAFVQDVLRRRAAQGGSTITQQFVKNAVSAQGNRSVFEKLREAALAYHLERKWSKQKILTQYLNTVYFGNGAYGVESAARTYFGDRQQAALAATGQTQTAHVDDGDQAEGVTPGQAALLAGMISSPTAYDPVEHPRRTRQRRDQVLQRMLSQGTITRGEYAEGLRESIPDKRQVNPPRLDSKQPYFSSWLTQQLVDRYGAGLVFGGGLKIETTIDPELQTAAEQAISRRLTGVGPTASLVAIENKTGEVKAMVGGTDYADKPFNLATNGHRQPGSAFKPFTLVAALRNGVSPEATFTSRKKVFPVPGSRKEKFVVNNYEDQYSGVASLRAATATSDNSVFAELGLKVGTHKIARLAQRMGLRTPVSTNPAMTLGGLKEGLTPLELAYAYTTIANRGRRVSGTLAPGGNGPVAIREVDGRGRQAENDPTDRPVLSPAVADTATQLLEGVIQGGTGRVAQIGEFAAGKTGTTENYGDAWFVGFNKQLTVAVWVGYPDTLKPMKTEYHGGPVAGGTYPAEIWHDFMTSWIGIRDTRDLADGKKDEQTTTPAPSGPVSPAPAAPATPPAETRGQTQQRASPEQQAPKQQQPKQQQPKQQQPQASPTPAPQQPQGGGGAESGGGTGPPTP
jgi:penicillin-binding protein 1A